MNEPAASALDWAEGLIAGNRKLLGRAITLVESTSEADQVLADQLLAACLPTVGGALRVAITGAPGAGKSTLIESLGLHLVDNDCSVAVLTIDPSGVRSGGSILGDKARMPKLSAHAKAYIRPSPSRGGAGGITTSTRQAILLCESAGYQVVIVETVGAGQIDIAVRDIVDAVVLLVLPHAGDELQGIKRGLLDTADVIGVSKADGDMKSAAEISLRQYRRSLAMRNWSFWQPPVLTCSALTGSGVPELWQAVRDFETQARAEGHFAAQRKAQAKVDVLNMAKRMLVQDFLEAAPELPDFDGLQNKVVNGLMTARTAAHTLATQFLNRRAGLL